MLSPIGTDSNEIEFEGTLVKLHGTFMVTAWMLAASCGILLARYYKLTWVGQQFMGKDLWFVVGVIASCLWMFVHIEANEMRLLLTVVPSDFTCHHLGIDGHCFYHHLCRAGRMDVHTCD